MKKDRSKCGSISFISLNKRTQMYYEWNGLTRCIGNIFRNDTKSKKPQPKHQIEQNIFLVANKISAALLFFT